MRSAVTTHADPTSHVAEVNGNHIAGTPGSAEAIYLPDNVALPWNVNVGAAVQLGPRPFNPRWLDPDEVVAQTKRYLRWRARERKRRRAFLLEKARKDGRNVAAAAKAIDAEYATEATLDNQHLDRVQARVRQELLDRERAMADFYVLISTQLLVTGPAKDAVGVESFLERVVNRSGEHTTYSPRLAVETELIPGLVQDPRRHLLRTHTLPHLHRPLARHGRLRPPRCSPGPCSACSTTAPSGAPPAPSTPVSATSAGAPPSGSGTERGAPRLWRSASRRADQRDSRAQPRGWRARRRSRRGRRGLTRFLSGGRRGEPEAADPHSARIR